MFCLRKRTVDDGLMIDGAVTNVGRGKAGSNMNGGSEGGDVARTRTSILIFIRQQFVVASIRRFQLTQAL
jgi:hypothetical protein